MFSGSTMMTYELKLTLLTSIWCRYFVNNRGFLWVFWDVMTEWGSQSFKVICFDGNSAHYGVWNDTASNLLAICFRYFIFYSRMAARSERLPAIHDFSLNEEIVVQIYESETTFTPTYVKCFTEPGDYFSELETVTPSRNSRNKKGQTLPAIRRRKQKAFKKYRTRRL